MFLKPNYIHEKNFMLTTTKFSLNSGQMTDKSVSVEVQCDSDSEIHYFTGLGAGTSSFILKTVDIYSNSDKIIRNRSVRHVSKFRYE